MVSDAGLKRVSSILNALKGFPQLEVVVNDFGVLWLLNSMRRFVPVAGRLLIRQKSDPRVIHIRGKNIRSLLRKTAADNTQYATLLKKNRVKRIEVDNILGGVELPEGFKISLYYPYVFLSVSMSICSGDCAGQCKSARLPRNTNMPADIFLKGNAQFYMNENTAIFKQRGIDRIIVQESLPC